jgi:hypothetical protein
VKNEAAALAARRAELAAEQASERRSSAGPRGRDRQTEALAEASNAVVDLVHAGGSTRPSAPPATYWFGYRDAHNGYKRLGMVYEARRDHQHAAECYRKDIEFVHSHPEDYDPEFASTFHGALQGHLPLGANLTRWEQFHGTEFWN